MSLTVFETVNILQGLKFHFTQKKFDYTKTPYVVSQAQLNKRKDGFALAKLAKHPDVFNYILSIVHRTPNIWTTELLSAECETRYLAWNKRRQSLTYNFTTEIETLHPNLNDNIKVVKNQHPLLIKKYLGNELSLETLLIVIDCCACFPYLNRVLQDDFIWQELSFLLRKYRPFVEYDKKKFSQILLNHFV